MHYGRCHLFTEPFLRAAISSHNRRYAGNLTRHCPHNMFMSGKQLPESSQHNVTAHCGARLVADRDILSSKVLQLPLYCYQRAMRRNLLKLA